MTKYIKKFILALNSRGYLKFLSDKACIKLIYKAHFGKDINLKDPKTYNEKLQWIKLYDRKEEYIQLVDKYGVRSFVADTIGEEYLIPVLGVWDNAEDINFETLPKQFVLKCTHDSGSVRICKDKNTFDQNEAVKYLNKKLRRDGYLMGREWPYKFVPRKIMAEQYMEDTHTEELRDYKFFTFDGKVKALFVASERQKANTEVKFDYFDENYNLLPFKQVHDAATETPEKPENFELMKQLAEKLSVGIPHVRVDFYEVNGKVYFGEMTFFHHCGYVPFNPEKWDRIFGDWINLPKSVGYK